MIQVDIAPIHDSDMVAALVNDVWATQYPDTHQLVRWPAAFFDWQFLRVPAEHPAVCLGARIDGRLEGVFCADLWRVTDLGTEATPVVFLSCVSVRPVRARFHISSALLTAARDWSEARGAQHFFGYVNPENSTLSGRRYWTSRRELEHVFVSGSRQWTLPASVMAQYEPLRDAHPTLLPADAAALVLAERDRRPTSSRYAALNWTQERLAHQFRYPGLADCTAAIEDKDHAVCSFYALPQCDGQSVGHIDILSVSDPTRALALRVLAGAVGWLRGRGCGRIFTNGGPCNDDIVLKTLGFVPCFPSFEPLIVGWGEKLAFGKDTRFSAIYR